MYNSYCDTIENVIISNQKKYRACNLSLGSLEPFEQIIMFYMIQIYQRETSHISPSTLFNIVDYFINNGTDESEKITRILHESEIMKNIVSDAMEEIQINDNSIKWNIHHSIQLQGIGQSLKLSTEPFMFTGYGKYTYHFKLVTELNNLNFWKQIIKIIVERFFISNPAGKGDDAKKFKYKPIKTYIFSLKTRSYHVYDFDWEENLVPVIKQKLKAAIVKIYSSTTTKQIFRLFHIVKKNKTIWESKSESPFDYIANRLKAADMLFRFFIKAHDTSVNDEAFAASMEDESVFCERFNTHVAKSCDTFFGLRK